MLSGLLRRYLLELPEPLVPVTHYKTLLSLLTSSKKFKNGKDRGGAAAVKQLVDGADFSKVHFHALRRVCGLMRTMLNSWWSDSGEAAQVLEIMGVNILRPDNLNRTVGSPKEMASIKEAVANLIAHSNSIFIANRDHSDSNARRISMIRKGERASRLQLMVDAENGHSNGGDSARNDANTRARRLSNVADTPRHDSELRLEFKVYRDTTNAEIAELKEALHALQGEVNTLRKQVANDSYASANGSDDESPLQSPKTKIVDYAPSITSIAVPVVSTPDTSSTVAEDSDVPQKKSSSKRLLRQESSTKSIDSSDVPLKRDSKRDLKDVSAEDSPKKHKHKKEK